MKDILDLKNHESPCIKCLVKMCCSAPCNEFILYYISLKTLVRLKLSKIGIDVKSREGFKIFRDLMLNVLREQKISHEKTIAYIETTIYELELSERRKK